MQHNSITPENKKHEAYFVFRNIQSSPNRKNYTSSSNILRGLQNLGHQMYDHYHFKGNWIIYKNVITTFRSLLLPNLKHLAIIPQLAVTGRITPTSSKDIDIKKLIIKIMNYFAYYLCNILTFLLFKNYLDIYYLQIYGTWFINQNDWLHIILYVLKRPD